MVMPQDLHIQDTRLGTGFEILSEFSAAKEYQRVLTTIWSAHTWVYRTFGTSPRIFFQADGPGRGKTVHLQVSSALAQNGLVLDYTSQASVYNWLEDHPDTTLGLDESDKIFGLNGRRTSRDILRSVVNGAYTSKGKVMVTRGGKSVLMPTYCPIGLAGLGALPADTADRSLIIQLEQGTPDMSYIPEMYEDDLNSVGADVGEWLQSRANQDILMAAPTMADVSGSPRFRLITAPLQAIAMVAGCLEQFKTGISEMQTGISEKPPVPRYVLLIQDLADVWGDEPILSGCEVIARLHTHISHRWDKLGQSRIGEIALSGMFREAGIESRVSNSVRGYRRDEVIGED